MFLVVGLAWASLGTVALADTIMDEPFDQDPFPDWEPPAEPLPPPPEGEPDPNLAPWEPHWIDVRQTDEDNTAATPSGYAGNGLDIDLDAGTQRAVGARYYFLLEDGDPDEIWFRYHLRFDQWYSGVDGKLPGPAGIYGYTARGCFPSVESSPGWSARVLYKFSGYEGTRDDQTQIGYYVYHLGQAGDCGDNMLWNPGVLDHNRWYCLEGHVRLNQPGASDGVLEGWLNGQLALQRTGMEFRRSTEDSVRVREFWLNLFHGGTVAAATDMSITVDQLVVSDSGRVGCFDPFEDDDGSVHEQALTELRDRDVYLGCAALTSCLKDDLSRYAMAVLLDRAWPFPKTTEDFFDDDDGHWAEPAINRLAAAGVTLGCAEREFCLRDTITRVQFAVMLDRTFGFPASSEDAFDDDNGHWAEATLDALAASGVMAGCDVRMACTGDTLTRGQGASLIARSLTWAEAG